MNNDEIEQYTGTGGQSRALPIDQDDEASMEVQKYLLSVRQEALTGPSITYVEATTTTVQSQPVNTNKEEDKQNVEEGHELVIDQNFIDWSDQLVNQLRLVKQQIDPSQLSSPIEDPYIPKDNNSWRKYMSENEPPGISYFYNHLDKPTIFKLIIYITKWLSISPKDTLSRWIWKLFIRIDTPLQADECSIMRDLCKKAIKIKTKQNLVANDEISTNSSFTVDMIIVVVSKYYGQLDLFPA
ncbi:BRR1 [[Candida] subhashii]|uniref:BRR1 n=1 Tax=[Candida] subhashii TaxID=561895 RepID=A0A8J5QQN7_9ASCO|nr:BRR1 [[Candida] subhashii]KAG7665619.1 BRR1 [[Candida] subhashii]